MKLEAIVTSNAFVELAEPEQDALVTRLGSGLELDASAVAHLDGDAANLSATDLRRCLLAWGVQPFSFVSLDQPAPIAIDVCERLLLLLDAARAGGEPRPELVEQASELGQRAAHAELARAELGFVPDVLLGALEFAIDAWVARASQGRFEADAVHEGLVGVGLEPLSKAILDYHRRTTGLHAWFDRMGRHAATALSDTRHGLLMLVAGKPEHEGRFDGCRWRNWSGSEQIEPRRFVVPENEPAIIEAVRSARRLRVVGGGHSFNGSPLCADTMLSLDACRRVLALDRQRRVIHVEAGLRLRDLSRVLAANGLALPVLGSTDAQSIGGLVATDLHGTGREHGFLSQQILGLRLVSAAGHART
ncbi:MAG TPA: FAD-binding protein, partial [Polyangiaceae bacterium]|nr:FAD-binding protein [Polyangiaceae bacterium]